MPDAGGIDLAPVGDYDNINKFLGDNDEMVVGGDETLQLRNAGALPRSESPLSDARSEIIHDLDGTLGESGDVEEEVVARQPQRSKKRKLLVLGHGDYASQPPDQRATERSIQDSQTSLVSAQRSITAYPDEHAKNGDFVSNIMGDGRSRGWAPELRGILSIECCANCW